MLDDEKLTKELSEDNKEAFDTLVRKYRVPAIRFAYSIVRNAESAEDIVQDCFVKIYIARKNCNPKLNFKSYVFTIVRNLSIDYLRKATRAVSFPPETIIQTASNDKMPEELLLENEELQAMYSHLKKLPKNYETAIYLYAIEDLSYKEIALVMKKTSIQVKNYISRGRAKLKELHKREGW